MGNSAGHLKEVFQRSEPPSGQESPASAQVQYLVDPRSPTVLFTRTPIEVQYSYVSSEIMERNIGC
jgi:hypothetical protein